MDIPSSGRRLMPHGSRRPRKKLQLFVEYPSDVPGFVLKDRAYVATGPYGSVLERTVITSDAFRPRLDPMRILVINDCYYLPISPRPETVHLALARVVGYATAKLGLPPANAPLLFELTGLASVAPTKEDTRPGGHHEAQPIRLPPAMCPPRPGGRSGKRSCGGCNRTRRCRP